jgi:restriction endonuclease S subunit
MMQIKAKFGGTKNDLDMFLSCGIKNYFPKTITTNTLFVTWVLDETNYEKAIEECMSLVNT